MLYIIHGSKIVTNSPINFSMRIQSVVDENIEKTSYSWNDAGCTACEMAVVWIKNQLRLNETEQHILDYASAVNHSSYSCFRKIINVLSRISYYVISIEFTAL